MYTKINKMKTNSIKAWIVGLRLYSLPASIIPVVVASALAYSEGRLNWIIALLCLLFATTMQCVANLSNDIFDFKKGADKPDRLGPDRAYAKGYITPRAMKWGVATLTLFAIAIGCTLLFYAGAWIIWVGVACVIFAFLYTATPWALAYNALGDVAVIIFFGVVPAGFTYMLQTGEWTPQITLASVACGLVINTLLWVNNFRDREQDAACGKRTIVVYLGEGVGRWGYIVLGSMAVLLCLGFGLFGMWPAALLPLVYWILCFKAWRKMVAIDSGKELNKILGESARNMTIFGALLTLGIILS